MASDLIAQQDREYEESLMADMMLEGLHEQPSVAPGFESAHSAEEHVESEEDVGNPSPATLRTLRLKKFCNAGKRKQKRRLLYGLSTCNVLEKKLRSRS